MCVKGKIEFLFFPAKYLLSEISNMDHKMEVLFKKGQDEYKYDCLKFKQYLSLTSNFFMVNISQFYGCE